MVKNIIVFSCLPPLSEFIHFSWKLVCVCPLSEKHTESMKMFTVTSAPSGSKAFCGQIFFWAAISTTILTAICLAGAPDGASNPGFDETFASPFFWSYYEPFCVAAPDAWPALREKKFFSAKICSTPPPTLRARFSRKRPTLYRFRTTTNNPSPKTPIPRTFSTELTFFSATICQKTRA